MAKSIQKKSTGQPFTIQNRAILLILIALVIATPLAGQFTFESSSDRKIVSRVEHLIPETLKRLFIGGAVRVQAIVAANGTVESTELLGGNPILGQATMKAIKAVEICSWQGARKSYCEI